MSIHTFGDSHSHNGWPDEVKTHHLGPILCYSFGKENLKRCDIRNYDVKNDDTIIFCFGEIDCRSHVNKHINETTSYKYIINNIIDNYFQAIKLNVIVSKIEFRNICVYNVVPPVEYYNTWENPEMPYLGSDNERKLYYLYFNEKLKEKCIENNYIFLIYTTNIEMKMVS
jgi:hypothetical protein